MFFNFWSRWEVLVVLRWWVFMDVNCSELMVIRFEGCDENMGNRFDFVFDVDILFWLCGVLERKL